MHARHSISTIPKPAITRAIVRNMPSPFACFPGINVHRRRTRICKRSAKDSSEHVAFAKQNSAASFLAIAKFVATPAGELGSGRRALLYEVRGRGGARIEFHEPSPIRHLFR